MNVGNLIAAGLPQHTHSGTTSSNGDHTHTRGSMEIWGNVSFYGVEAWYGGGAGAFYVSVDNATSISHHTGGQEKIPTLNFNASRHWTGSTSSNGAHTHTMTTGNASNIIYGNSTTVQPPSQLVHICIRYK